MTLYPGIGKSYDDFDIFHYYTHLFCKVNEKNGKSQEQIELTGILRQSYST
jgi:hypothetical protein